MALYHTASPWNRREIGITLFHTNEMKQIRSRRRELNKGSTSPQDGTTTIIKRYKNSEENPSSYSEDHLYLSSGVSEHAECLRGGA